MKLTKAKIERLMDRNAMASSSGVNEAALSLRVHQLAEQLLEAKALLKRIREHSGDYVGIRTLFDEIDEAAK